MNDQCTVREVKGKIYGPCAFGVWAIFRRDLLRHGQASLPKNITFNRYVFDLQRLNDPCLAECTL